MTEVCSCFGIAPQGNKCYASRTSQSRKQ